MIGNQNNMKIPLLWLSFVFLAFTHPASAQISVNKDSLSLVKKLTSDKEKLLKLQGQVNDQTKEKEQTAAKAQQSADENRQAANKLSNDPQNSKLARRADNSASDARSDAKKARKAAERLEDLTRDISDLNEKIARNETKLSKYVLRSNTPMPAPAVVTPRDSTLPNHK